MNDLRIAIIHDHISAYGGAERVLFALHSMFPKAPIYTLWADEGVLRRHFPNATVRTTALQRIPGVYRKRFRYLAPLAVAAVENIDLSEYNLVISSSSFFAKGVITRPDALHISYCHTPPRALWGAKGESAAGDPLLGALVGNMATHALRMWDVNAASRVDRFVANSQAVRGRIGKYYRKGAAVIYPPVQLQGGGNGTVTGPLQKRSVLSELPDDFFLIVSHLSEHKRIDVAVEAFSKLSFPLVIIGDGPQREALEEAAGKHTVFLGAQPDDVVAECYRRCRAYIHPGEEDFGLAPVEAMLAGKPVLAYRRGGVCESVQEGVSGEFFDSPHPAVLADGVRRINERIASYDPQLIRTQAERFSLERFTREFRAFLREELARHIGRSQLRQEARVV